MDKQLFDEVIGEVPPATFEVDGLVTRGRRAVRVRRVVNPAVAAGLAVLLLSGAVVFSMTRDDGGPTRVGGQPPTSATTETTTTTTKSTSETAVPAPKAPAACANPDDLESPAEAVARLGPAARTLVAAARPELRLSPNMTGNGRGPLDFGHDSPRAAGQTVCDQFSSFVAAATTAAPDGTGNIIISMGPVYSERPGSCEESEVSYEPYCEVATGPNGEDIVKSTTVQENGVTTKTVAVVKPDGTSVWLAAENVATSVKTEDDATAAQPPLDHDQLVTIGTDPKLTLFP